MNIIKKNDRYVKSFGSHGEYSSIPFLKLHPDHNNIYIDCYLASGGSCADKLFIKYSPNLGLVLEDFWFFEGEYTYEMTGYIKDGVQTGIVYSDSWLLSVDENENTNKINLWPNPANEFFNISLNNLQNKTSTLIIYNNLGQMVFSKLANVGETKISISSIDFPDGIYFIEVDSGEEILRYKLIIRH